MFFKTKIYIYLFLSKFYKDNIMILIYGPESILISLMIFLLRNIIYRGFDIVARNLFLISFVNDSLNSNIYHDIEIGMILNIVKLARYTK